MEVVDKGNRFEEEKQGVKEEKTVIEMNRKVERFERFEGRDCCKMDDFVSMQEVEGVQHQEVDSDSD